MWLRLILFLWHGSGHATPEYGTLAYWIFQTEGIWEIVCAGGAFWPSPEAGHKTLFLPTPGGKEHPYLQRPRQWTQKGPAWIGLAKFPQFTTLPRTLCSITSFQDSPLFNILRFNCFFRPSFPYEGSHACKTYIKQICMPFSCCLSFATEAPVENLKGEGEKVFFLSYICFFPDMFPSSVVLANLFFPPFPCFRGLPLIELPSLWS